jgi:hypothetical protein
MAVHLGLSDSLKRDDFSRIYYPTAMADEAHLRNLRRAAEKKSLEEARLQANVAPMFAGAPSPYPPKPTANS